MIAILSIRNAEMATVYEVLHRLGFSEKKIKGFAQLLLMRDKARERNFITHGSPNKGSLTRCIQSRIYFKKTIALSAVFVFILCQTNCFAKPNNDKKYVEAFRLIDNWLDSIHAYHKIPALSAGIVIGDKLVWAKGFGNVDAKHEIPASPDTIYSICSISKLFTSIAIMQQYEAGKFNLDDSITTHLSWATLKKMDGEQRNITIQRILSHSAGLPREFDYPYWSAPDFIFPEQDLIKQQLSNQSIFTAPGRYYHYSNLGMVILGMLIEKISGLSYSDYCKMHLLEPLGLINTRTYFPATLLEKQLAAGYGAITRDGVRQKLNSFDAKGMTAAAGYTSTVSDLAKFISWQFRLLRSNQANLLKPSTLREMQRPQFLFPDWKSARGLGFLITHKQDKTYIGHDGKCPGYSTELVLRNQDETGVIILMNAMEEPDPILYGIYAILDKRLNYRFDNSIKKDKVDLESYSGRYSSQPWTSEEIIAPWSGGLVLLVLPTITPEKSMFFLKPVGNDLFLRIRDDGSEAEMFQFKRNSSNQVTGYFHYSNWSKRLV